MDISSINRMTRRITKLVYDPQRKIYQPALTEEHILKEIVTRLWLEYRIPVFRINCPVGGKVRPNVRGLPDLVGYVPQNRAQRTGIGRDVQIPPQRAISLWIEVKRPKGHRRPEQEQFIRQAKADGCIAFFAESWELVAAELQYHGIEPI